MMNFKHIVAGFSGWEIKMTKSGQLELKKKFVGTHSASTLLLIAGGPDGYDHKWYKKATDEWDRSTKGIDLHWSANGPLQLTFQQMDEIHQVTKNIRDFYNSSVDI